MLEKTCTLPLPTSRISVPNWIKSKLGAFWLMTRRKQNDVTKRPSVRQNVGPEPRPPDQVIRQIQHIETSGPLPPPSILKAYDEVVPGCAAIICKQMQDESAHRRDLSKIQQAHDNSLGIRNMQHFEKIQKDAHLERKIGQVCAGLVCAGALIVAGVVSVNGTVAGSITGSIVSGSAIVPIVLAFLKNKQSSDEESIKSS